VNATILLATLRQRLSSPIRVLMLGFLMLTSLGMVAVTRTLVPVEGQGLMFGLILAAGAIGQEIASGVLTLTFARPITRSAYVLSRWLAAGALASGLALAQLAMGAAIVLARGGAAPAAGDLAAYALEGVLLAFTGSAVLVMLSSIATGLGDVGLWVTGIFLGKMVEGLGQIKEWPVVVRAAQEVQGFLYPQVRLGWLFGHGDPSWFALVSVVSTLALSLAVAVMVVNRKELSYAAG
jgi:ABC-type transport system involved in multi-copper enzyme maturation permease subunit